jgi:hypothetical protein
MDHKRLIEHALRWLAAVGPLLFLAIASIEGSLRAEYDPIAEPISALALGPRGWIQKLNFVLLAASFLSFAVVLRTELRDGVASVVAPAVFLLMTIGVTLAGIFTMDAPGVRPTIDGRLHDGAGFLVFPWMPLVLFLVARRFRRDTAWRPYFGYTLVTAFVCLATMIFFLLFVGLPSGPPLPASGIRGLVQRFLMLVFFTWIALVAWRSRRGAHGFAVDRSYADDRVESREPLRS